MLRRSRIPLNSTDPSVLHDTFVSHPDLRKQWDPEDYPSQTETGGFTASETHPSSEENLSPVLKPRLKSLIKLEHLLRPSPSLRIGGPRRVVSAPSPLPPAQTKYGTAHSHWTLDHYTPLSRSNVSHPASRNRIISIGGLKSRYEAQMSDSATGEVDEEYINNSSSSSFDNVLNRPQSSASSPHTNSGFTSGSRSPQPNTEKLYASEGQAHYSRTSTALGTPQVNPQARSQGRPHRDSQAALHLKTSEKDSGAHPVEASDANSTAAVALQGMEGRPASDFNREVSNLSTDSHPNRLVNKPTAPTHPLVVEDDLHQDAFARQEEKDAALDVLTPDTQTDRAREKTSIRSPSIVLPVKLIVAPLESPITEATSDTGPKGTERHLATEVTSPKSPKISEESVDEVVGADIQSSKHRQTLKSALSSPKSIDDGRRESALKKRVGGEVLPKVMGPEFECITTKGLSPFLRALKYGILQLSQCQAEPGLARGGLQVKLWLTQNFADQLPGDLIVISPDGNIIELMQTESKLTETPTVDELQQSLRKATRTVVFYTFNALPGPIRVIYNYLRKFLEILLSGVPRAVFQLHTLRFQQRARCALMMNGTAPDVELEWRGEMKIKLSRTRARVRVWLEGELYVGQCDANGIIADSLGRSLRDAALRKGSCELERLEDWLALVGPCLKVADTIREVLDHAEQ